MMTPTIHLNGTSRDALLEQATDAGNAIRQAMKAVEDAEPNGRDYYPQGSDALSKAQKEHVARLVKLRSVYDEYAAIAEDIAGIHRD
jgi:hypothetical protein